MLNKTLHASVALEAGVRLLLCVNALVPFDASPMQASDSRDKLAHGGLPMVLAQTFRAIIHSRMEVGMDRYRAQHGKDVVFYRTFDRDPGWRWWRWYDDRYVRFYDPSHPRWRLPYPRRPGQ